MKVDAPPAMPRVHPRASVFRNGSTRETMNFCFNPFLVETHLPTPARVYVNLVGALENWLVNHD